MSFTMRSIRPMSVLFRLIGICLPAPLFLLVLVNASYGQESMPQHAPTVTLLTDALQEAEQNNPQIQA
ncbi:MAG: hypothetical protein WCB00_25425, partial [Candidatus Acidiferrales bacterium]